ncbi:MAG: hypothetical protein JWO94_3201 [Verrucomicrobiaceae bacterium]|nr:hypothetical protein [Verrucomicrobiaceae bacterium]
MALMSIAAEQPKAARKRRAARAAASHLLPGLSLALVQEFASIEPSSRAVREFRERLQTTVP